jgi:hypothetical protein
MAFLGHGLVRDFHSLSLPRGIRFPRLQLLFAAGPGPPDFLGLDHQIFLEVDDLVRAPLGNLDVVWYIYIVST